MAVHPLLERTDPIVILAKGHSGTRFLAQALEENGVFIGADLNPMHDSLAWANDFAIPLVLSRWFPGFDRSDPELEAEISRRLEITLENYAGSSSPDGPWGWKGSTTFVMEPLLRRFPRLRLIHIVRDGRDVALSEDGHLNLPFWHPVPRRPDKAARVLARRLGFDDRIDRYRRRIYFGSDDDTWMGFPVRRAEMLEHRYLVQMEGWRRNVAELRRIGDALGDRYTEIRYEDLVAQPESTVRSVLVSIGLSMSPSTERFVAERAFRTSLRKWERTPPSGDRAIDFDAACAHGTELLEELGYD